jgi:hypothetical protein
MNEKCSQSLAVVTVLTHYGLCTLVSTTQLLQGLHAEALADDHPTLASTLQ